METTSVQQANPPHNAFPIAPSIQPDLYNFLGRAIFRLRWATLGLVLLIALVLPSGSQGALPSWTLVAIFAGYNLLADWLRRRLAAPFSFLWLAIADLPVAGLLYLLGAAPGGPLFVLLVLAVDSAAASLALRGIIAYTGVVALLAAGADLLIGLPAPASTALSLLAVRLVALGLLGAAMAILTRRLALEHTLTAAAHDQSARMAALSNVRADFIATISHELRTPLTAARAALVLLNTSAADRHQPDEQRLLDNARRNIERLSLLIGDLLTYNQLEAGTLQLDCRPSDLSAIAADAVAAVSPLLQEKGQLLDVDLPAPLPLTCDALRVEQVLVNLLANAHHHTPRGTHISLIGRSLDGEIRLVVHDTGPGLPADELEAIFERFYRVGHTTTGSGLGLAIARQIVQLHGGRIWADSRPGAGTTFSVALPIVAYGEPT